MTNKISMKINAADTVSNFTESMRTFLQNYDPKIMGRMNNVSR